MHVHGSPHSWVQSKGSGAGWGSGADRQQVWCGGSSQHVTLGAACRNVQLHAILSHSLAWPAHLGPQAWPVPTKVKAVHPGNACDGGRGAGGGLEVQWCGTCKAQTAPRTHLHRSSSAAAICALTLAPAVQRKVGVCQVARRAAHRASSIHLKRAPAEQWDIGMKRGGTEVNCEVDCVSRTSLQGGYRRLLQATASTHKHTM